MAIPCDSTSLVAAAACYECQIPPGMQMSVLIWIMCQIANNGTGGGAGLVGIGSPQGIVTAAAGTTYLDTATDNFWVNSNGTINGWVELIGN